MRLKNLSLLICSLSIWLPGCNAPVADRKNVIFFLENTSIDMPRVLVSVYLNKESKPIVEDSLFYSGIVPDYARYIESVDRGKHEVVVAVNRQVVGRELIDFDKEDTYVFVSFQYDTLSPNDIAVKRESFYELRDSASVFNYKEFETPKQVVFHVTNQEPNHQ